MERFDAEGGFELKRSLWSMALILLIDAGFAFLAISPLVYGRPELLPLTLGLLGVPIIAAVVWVVVMVNPLVRVRVDGSGVTVHKHERVRWEWITTMDQWIDNPRVGYRYLALRLHDNAPAGKVQRRTGARIETLPFLLAPNAKVQFQALGEIHRRIRERAEGELAH